MQLDAGRLGCGLEIAYFHGRKLLDRRRGFIRGWNCRRIAILIGHVVSGRRLALLTPLFPCSPLVRGPGLRREMHSSGICPRGCCLLEALALPVSFDERVFAWVVWLLVDNCNNLLLLEIQRQKIHRRV